MDERQLDRDCLPRTAAVLPPHPRYRWCSSSLQDARSRHPILCPGGPMCSGLLVAFSEPTSPGELGTPPPARSSSSPGS